MRAKYKSMAPTKATTKEASKGLKANLLLRRGRLETSDPAKNHETRINRPKFSVPRRIKRTKDMVKKRAGNNKFNLVCFPHKGIFL